MLMSLKRKSCHCWRVIFSRNCCSRFTNAHLKLFKLKLQNLALRWFFQIFFWLSHLSFFRIWNLVSTVMILNFFWDFMAIISSLLSISNVFQMLRIHQFRNNMTWRILLLTIHVLVQFFIIIMNLLKALVWIAWL